MSAAARAAATALALAVLPPAGAQAPAADPDSPETHARAKQGLATATPLPVAGESLPVKGEERAVVGLKSEVAGQIQDLGGLLRDLNAEVRGQQVRIALSADVLFDFDKAVLKPEAAPSLEKVVAVFKAYPKATATIEGHTDSKGDDAYNQKLSERRADSVRKWLAEHGAKLRMATRGWGEKKPLVPNAKPDGKDDPEARSKNRRVEITVKNE